MKKLLFVFALVVCLAFAAHAANIDELTLQAEKGDVAAQSSLGKLYYIGHEVKQNYSEAFRWFTEAGYQENKEAQYYLGYMYEMGYGVEKDYGESLKWLTRSAMQGYSHAQSRLGVKYYYSQGVNRNIHEAMKWLDMAAAQNDSMAQHILSKINNSKNTIKFFDIEGTKPISQTDIDNFCSYIEMAYDKFDEDDFLSDEIQDELNGKLNLDHEQSLYAFSKIYAIYEAVANGIDQNNILSNEAEAMAISKEELDLVINNMDKIDYALSLLPESAFN